MLFSGFSLTLQIDKFFKSLLRWASRSVGILRETAENYGFFSDVAD